MTLRVYLIIFRSAVFFTLFFQVFDYAIAASEQQSTINIILSGDKTLYQEVAKGIRETIIRLGHQDFQLNIITIENDAQKQLLTSKKSNAILNIAVGAKAAEYVLKKHLRIPLISTFIPKHNYLTLLDRLAQNSRSFIVGAVFIDQPFDRQIKLAQQIIPNLRNIGIPLGPISSMTLQQEQRFLHKSDYQVNTALINEDGINVTEMKQLVESSDIIMAVPDPLVNRPSNAKWILYNAYQAKVPIIAFSQAYVNAGAVASIYSTPLLIGQQTAECVVAYLETRKIKVLQNEYAKYFKVKINSAVAEALGIQIPNAEVLEKRIQQLEKPTEYVINN